MLLAVAVVAAVVDREEAEAGPKVAGDVEVVAECLKKSEFIHSDKSCVLWRVTSLNETTCIIWHF